VDRERWLLKRSNDLLPVTYFHGVFTVPSELRILFLYNKKRLYNLLFQCVWETIYSFGMDPRQKLEGKPGMIGILPTWNQQMQYHPHIHCILPGGGLTEKGEWKGTKGKADFLFSVAALSSKFKKKFLILLTALYKNGDLSIPDKDPLWNSATSFYKTKKALYKKDWVVYNKPSFKDHHQVFEYLGRYTHKIAISNHRIIKITDTHVTFRYLDRKKEASATRTLTGEKFILCFLQHVLPKRFTKIRHYGFLSTRSKKADLERIRKALDAKSPEEKKKLSAREIIIKTTGQDPYLCPHCKTDTMRIIKITPAIRGSPRPFLVSRSLLLV